MNFSINYSNSCNEINYILQCVSPGISLIDWFDGMLCRDLSMTSLFSTAQRLKVQSNCSHRILNNGSYLWQNWRQQAACRIYKSIPSVHIINVQLLIKYQLNIVAKNQTPVMLFICMKYRRKTVSTFAAQERIKRIRVHTYFNLIFTSVSAPRVK